MSEVSQTTEEDADSSTGLTATASAQSIPNVPSEASDPSGARTRCPAPTTDRRRRRTQFASVSYAVHRRLRVRFLARAPRTIEVDGS